MKVAHSLEGKKIVFFHDEFTTPGGSERVALEEAKYLEQSGAKTYILTYDFSPEALFNGAYHPDVQVIGKNILYPRSRFKGIVYFPWQVLALRRKLKTINPDVIISRTSFGCIYLYLATLFTPFVYVTKIYETTLWADNDQRQHALIYRKAFNRIRALTTVHSEFASLIPAKANPVKRIIAELAALAEYRGVRKAKKIFVYSSMMKWESEEIYKKEAIVLKGGLPDEIFAYKPKQDIKEKLGVSDRRMLLSVCRLVSRKRVDLLVKAFQLMDERFADVVLVIGGQGPEEENLKRLARELKIEDKVKFVGFIPEEELWDYYAACDVFVHPDWADFDLTPYMALALQKKVVCPAEMEVDHHLQDSGYIFVAQPTADDFASAVEKALVAKATKNIDLSAYTWRNHCQAMIRELSPFLSHGA